MKRSLYQKFSRELITTIRNCEFCDKKMLKDRKSLDLIFDDMLENEENEIEIKKDFMKLLDILNHYLIVLSNQQINYIYELLMKNLNNDINEIIVLFLKELLEDLEDFNAESIIKFMDFFMLNIDNNDICICVLFLSKTNKYCACKVASKFNNDIIIKLLQSNDKIAIELLTEFVKYPELTQISLDFLPLILEIIISTSDFNILNLCLCLLLESLNNINLFDFYIDNSYLKQIFINQIGDDKNLELKLAFLRDLSSFSKKADKIIFKNDLFPFVYNSFINGNNIVKCYCVDIFRIISEFNSSLNDLLYESNCIDLLLNLLHEDSSIQLIICTFIALLTIFNNSQAYQQLQIINSDFLDVFCDYFNSIPLNYLEILTLKLLEIIKKAELNSNNKILFYFYNNKTLIELYSDLISNEKKEPILTYALSFISRNYSF